MSENPTAASRVAPIFYGTEGRVLGRAGVARRAELLAALESAVAAMSWREVTVLELARRVGCSPAAFYQYFPSLTAAFDVLCEEITGRGGRLPTRIEAIARARAVETGVPFPYPAAPAPADRPGAYRTRTVGVRAVQWTGQNEAEVQKLAGAGFQALDEADRADGDDPEATAELLATEHSTWVPVHTGRWIVLEADGALSVLDEHAFAARYEPCEVAAPTDDESGEQR